MNPLDGDLPTRLAVSIGRINRRLRTVEGGLSHGLLSALFSVSQHGPIRLSDLARHELVSAPSITRLVSELESQGLVARTVDPDDGRAFLIEVTDAGTAAMQRTRSSRAALMGELLDQLGPDAESVKAALPGLERMAQEP
jgi:DNA-binding MarR family transcriptional regulator